jgi:hypothetical protein
VPEAFFPSAWTPEGSSPPSLHWQFPSTTNLPLRPNSLKPIKTTWGGKFDSAQWMMMKSTVITYPGPVPQTLFSLQRDQGLARSWPLELHAITPLLLVLQVSLSRLGLLASKDVPKCLLGDEEALPAICWSI